jgi:hypothetical protein
MNEFGDWIKLLGGIAGLAALAWRMLDEFGAYLRLSVKAEAPKDGWVTILTNIDNKGNRSKDLSYACLLVGPENESPLDSAGVIAEAVGYSGDLRYTNDLSNLRPKGSVYANGRVLIPLPFYYSENIRVGDETLTYRAPIDIRRLRAGLPYAVRFFVFAKNRFHRSTHDCFITESAQSEAELPRGPKRAIEF